MPEKTCKAAESKKQVVAKIIKLAKENPIIGIINMENLPAGNLQKIKAKLRGQIELVMTRKTLIKLALEQSKLENGHHQKVKDLLVQERQPHYRHSRLYHLKNCKG